MAVLHRTDVLRADIRAVHSTGPAISGLPQAAADSAYCPGLTSKTGQVASSFEMVIGIETSPSMMRATVVGLGSWVDTLAKMEQVGLRLTILCWLHD